MRRTATGAAILAHPTLQRGHLRARFQRPEWDAAGPRPTRVVQRPPPKDPLGNRVLTVQRVRSTVSEGCRRGMLATREKEGSRGWSA